MWVNNQEMKNMPAYHARERHARECAHAPCRCPGDACAFSAPAAALADHLADAHGWPCTVEAEAGRSFGVDLRDGFNFVTAVRGGARYVFLLNVASTALGRAVSAVAAVAGATTMASSSAAPEAGRKATTCELELKCSRYQYGPCYQREHYQTSRFEVACTDGSNGLRDPNASFQFFIPNYVAGSESEEAAFRVTAGVYINS
ncbi:hypothetical protein U9M48_042067 [Paspalum notatum var. saurae]|uniref:SIAH-type domain-containing protein n=1 Tax=Paspalum notatum var. saurae TaxID=547442 RepID=A0AAQ3UW58_PASNO